MNALSTPKLVLKRFADDRSLLAAVFVGITVAITMVTIAPVYLAALERLALNLAIDGLERPFSNVNTFSYKLPLTRGEMQRTDQAVAEAVERHLLPIQDSRERYLIVGSLLAGLPDRPLPPPGPSEMEREVLRMAAFMRRSYPPMSETRLMSMARDMVGAGAPGAVPPTSRQAPSSNAPSPGDDGGRASFEGEVLEMAAVLRTRLPPMSESSLLSLAREIVGTDFIEPQQAPSSDAQSPGDDGGSAARLPPNRVALRHLSHLEDHVTFVRGRMASAVLPDYGPLIEAVISPATADQFDLRVGDIITVVATLGAPERVLVRVAGIVEATDPWEDFWKPHASIFLDPTNIGEVVVEGLPSDTRQEYDPDRPPIPLFTTMEALTEVVGRTYPGTTAESIWFMMVDKEQLKHWTVAEVRSRLNAYEDQVTKAVPGSEVLTRIQSVLNGFERRSFFSKVPLLLLTAVVVVALLFFLSMMVSYLVQSREGDSALLRTRGLGITQLLRLYVLEGLVMTSLAVVVGPWLAMAAVALAGKLPYFGDMARGEMLPVEITLTPFLVALGAGLVCLVVYVVPGMLSTRGGLLAHKLRSSRPPSIPFFHRYHVDVALLAFGGLTYWELSNRGHLISGGLFKDMEVNETLLLAPVLFLVVVALVFMRFFPLVVRFISGESQALLHLLAVAGIGASAVIVVARDVLDGGGPGWLVATGLLLVFGAVYWASSRARTLRLRLAGVISQAGLVAGFLALERPEAGDALFAPTLLLIAVVPGQAAFPVLRWSARAAPVWVTVALQRMGRNPLQYTWLVLLLVLVTGVGVLSTTVGETLVRNQQDRINYEVAADMRVSEIDRSRSGGARALKDRYLDTPGVTSVSLAFRKKRVGVAAAQVELLGLESHEFPYLSWYRDDFSSLPLGGVMGALRSHGAERKLPIPDGAHTIGVWIKPEEVYPGMSLWMVIEDDTGRLTTLTLGRVGPPEWHLMEAAIPGRLEPPLSLVSVQVYEAGRGAVLTPGRLLLDDIYLKVGPRDDEHILVDFETLMRWTPIFNSSPSPDRLLLTTGEPHRGQMAGSFSFGGENQMGVRGFYLSPTGGPLPVVVSTSFSEATGTEVNQVLTVGIDNRYVPVVIRDIIRYFPTMSSNGGGFMIADLDGLLAHLNIISHRPAYQPNELFLKGTPSAHEAVRNAVSLMGGFSGQVTDRASLLDSARLDPLTAAGWRSMVVLSLGVVVLVAVMGYATHLLSFAARSESEMGFLKSLGFSRRQLLGLMGFEHLAIVAMGLGLGTVAGFQMSRTMVSVVSVTETGDRVVPPFLLMTDWGVMLPTYAALIATFVAVLFVLNRGIGRLDLQAISRGEAR